MPCTPIKIGDVVAIVRHGKFRYPRCRFCNKSQPATLLCDFVVAYTLMGEPITCDAKVCPGCARRYSDGIDICPKHAEGSLGVDRAGVPGGL